MKYDRAALLIVYPAYHRYYSGHTSYKPPAGYYDFMDDVEVNRGEMLGHQEFRGYAEMYINHHAVKRIDEDEKIKLSENPYYLAVFSVIDDLITDPDVKTYLYREFMVRLVNSTAISQSDTLVSIFKQNYHDSAIVKQIDNAIERWSKLLKGLPAPAIAYPDINGDTISLDDFKGKYVYVDVWATWCSPCIAEIPAFKALQEEFKNRNIVFVSVSVDAGKAAWETMLKEQNLEGIQLYAGTGSTSSIMRDYNIRGIPRYILIDREGKIIDVNASRPSGKIRNVLLQLEGL
jgi:thiol-disulfide isomerase/thioredoxin